MNELTHFSTFINFTVIVLYFPELKNDIKGGFQKKEKSLELALCRGEGGHPNSLSPKSQHIVVFVCFLRSK